MAELLPKKTSKRKYIRYIRKDIKVSVSKLDFFGFKKIIACNLLNISSAGSQLFTEKKIKKNTRLTLTLHLTNNKEIELKAQVVYCLKINNYLSHHRYPSIKKIVTKKDISLSKLDLYELNKKISAKYRDLSNISVTTLTRTQLNKKKHNSLLFNLSNGEKYRIYTQISDCQHFRNYNYGVKFENPSDQLADYLLATQTDLIK